MTNDLVLPFDALDRSRIAVAGGKAANLGELTRAGFPVPSGFCVTTAAYRAAARGSVLAEIVEELASVERSDAARLRALAENARAALAGAPIPDDVARACVHAYRALGDAAAVAVRSSATAEDLPDASFAGQQDTYLNVQGEDAVLDAIRRCWASLWTERAVSYRAANAIDHRVVELAVVVQRMVRASVAGVMFTANPVTGRRHEAVIDASPGLGEAVVSGAVNPDHFEVRVDTGEVVVRRLGDKKLVIESMAGGGTRHVIREDASAEACVSDDDIARLVALGAKVEAYYGAPQDTEWGMDEERTLWLLQSRPVTTLHPLPALAPDAGLHVYFNFNVAQGVFRPLTPMGRQCWRMFVSGIVARAGIRLDRYAGPPIVVDAAERFFIDVTALMRSDIGRRVVDFVLPRMEARSAESVRPLLADPRLSIVPAPKLRLLFFMMRALVGTRIPLRVLRALVAPDSAPARSDRAAESALALGVVAEDAGPRARIEAVERMLFDGMWRFFLVGVPMFLCGMIGFVIAKKRLAGIATSDEIETAFRALPHNPTTEMDLALWALACRVRGDATTRALVRETAPAELTRRWREGALPRALADGLAEFLARYGARGVAEIDVGVARWGEDPTHILGSIANYLALDDGAHAPDAQFAKATREADAMVLELCRRARAKGVVRGFVVRVGLDRMRRLAGIREAPKFNMVRVLARARALLLDVGRSLVDAGVLDAADDVFFLSLTELRAATPELHFTESQTGDARRLVMTRRATFARELGRRHLPRVLLSDGTEPEVPPTETADGALTGTPASAGVIEGIARVVLDPTGAKLEPGEILVAPSTDPGWTPLFLTAGGLVMEMGGSMSHGAVVAREYGIPAVVGVAHATTRITSGMRIRVDGAAGTVTIAC